MMRKDLILHLSLVFVIALMTGCSFSSSTSEQQTVPSPTVSESSNARAVKVLFKTPTFDNPSGSFDTPSGLSGMTTKAVRLYKPDGELLASTGDATWPGWLVDVEVGISGSNNSAATNANCARFATADDAANGKCYKTPAADADAFDCSAPEGYYRVSEVDCLSDTIREGDGTAGDGVTIRATFNRDTTRLGSAENVMAIVEYSASALSVPNEASPCFTKGRFSAEACSDLTWKAFLRSSTAETGVAPFLMLVPPSVGVVNRTDKKAGSGMSTKKIILPLAADPTLQVFQLSRIRSRLTKNDKTLTEVCRKNDTTAGNSPLCAGLILYSITFYRI
ncbi:MAG: hypothetical protein A2X94_10025 [Bdellovibrionales bacterium GWB1_55_8]|nr:MAG: hypothetical protein A2X94_10025 [Bdellovibrionales bacterium GWB1_55_8]